MSPNERDSFATVSEAARRRGIYAPRIRRAIRSGALPGYRIGAWLRVRLPDVDAWLAAQRVGQPTEAERLRDTLAHCRGHAVAAVSGSAPVEQALSNIIDVATAALDGQHAWGDQR